MAEDPNIDIDIPPGNILQFQIAKLDNERSSTKVQYIAVLSKDKFSLCCSNIVTETEEDKKFVFLFIEHNSGSFTGTSVYKQTSYKNEHRRNRRFSPY